MPKMNKEQLQTPISGRKLARDEIKRKSENDKKRKELGKTIDATIALLRRRPELIDQPEFISIKKYITDAATNPTQFGFSLPDAVAANSHLVFTQERPELTKGVSSRLRNRQPLVANDTTINNYPLVQLIFLEPARLKVNMNGAEMRLKKFKVHAVDGDNEAFLIHMDTSLNSSMPLVDVGSCIRLVKFSPIYLDFNNVNDMHVCLLVKNFVVHSRCAVPPSVAGKCPSYKVDKDLSRQAPRQQRTAQNDTTTNDVVATDDAASRCDGRLCSKYGISFMCCVTVAHPVTSISLETIREENPFVSDDDLEKAIDELQPGAKRFLLYYWYATNIYKIGGHHNRKELPKCLLLAIRKKYPNPLGQPYTDFAFT